MSELPAELPTAPSTGSTTGTAPGKPAPKRENLLLNLLFNIAVPTLVLSWMSSPGQWQWLARLLGSTSVATPDVADDKVFAAACGLVLALLFPLVYGAYDIIARRKANTLSILGFCSVLLSGGMGLLQADLHWFAIKEAGLPLIIGVLVLVTQRTKRPMIRELLYNDQVLDTARIDAALAERGNGEAFERVLARCSYLLAGSFLLSAVLNYALARWILRSMPGTEEFNAELGRMNMLSWPVIVLPSVLISLYALRVLIKGLRSLANLSLEEAMHTQPERK